MNDAEANANNDHHNHPNAPNPVDLESDEGTVVVAAASGIIRGIVDYNGDSADLGDGLAYNGTPQDDSLEHSCIDLEDDEGNNIDDSVVKGFCQYYNNYVWIEHPNGEWTKYTHLRTGSDSDPVFETAGK